MNDLKKCFLFKCLRGRETQRECFHLLVHSPNAGNSLDWAAPETEPETQSLSLTLVPGT